MDGDGIYRALGTSVAQRRRELGMTQDVLALAVGLTRASVANIEAGKQRVLLHTVYRLISALKLARLSDLLPEPEMVLEHSDESVAIIGDSEGLDAGALEQIERIWRES